MWERFFGFLKPRVRFEDWVGDVQTLPPPDSVTLPLSMPNQMPFNPVVEVGESVKTGQFIAMRKNRTGVHASITGKVTSIGPAFSWTGDEVLTLTIQREGDDDFIDPHILGNLETASKDELIQTMADLGFGSPWKPESLKGQLTELERIPITTVIITAVDSEPPLSVGRRFLSEFSHDLKESVVGLKKISGDARVIVVVPENMADKAKSLFPDIEIQAVGNSVLDTNLTLILQKVTGKFYTSHEDPRRDGTILLNAEDVAFLARCLHKGKSRTNKLLTVFGPGLEKPVTVRTRLGTPVQHVLDCLKVPFKSGDRIIFGGPLMGMAQPDETASICRGVNGVVVVPHRKVVPFTDAPCINCGRCGWVCPVNIQVNLVGRYAEFGLFEKAVVNGSGSCVECGMCAYVCPSRRPLVQYMRFANFQYDRKQEELKAEIERRAREDELVQASSSEEGEK